MVMEDEEEEAGTPRDLAFEAITSPLPKRRPLFPLSPITAARMSTSSEVRFLPFIWVSAVLISFMLFQVLKRIKIAKNRLSTSPSSMWRKGSYQQGSGMISNDLVSSSRGGVISPRNIEPLQCMVFFYASCWNIPRADTRKLKK